MKKIILLIMLLFSYLSVNSQYNYQPLISYGIIPDDFILRPEQKLLLNKYQKEETKYITNETKETFYRQSNHILDYLYRSGKITFNNNLYNYVYKVASYLLKDNPEILSEIRFYIIDDYSFNAFTTSDGGIFIHIGLLAKLETEAQLAFIIGHEVSHFTNKHSLESYYENSNLKKGTGSYKNLSYDSKLIKFSEYSKDQELLADKESLSKFINKTTYNIESIKKIFDLTLLSHLPLGNQDSIYSVFMLKDFDIPSEYIIQNTTPVSVNENYYDTLSSHPNIKARKENFESLIANGFNNGKSDFIISEQEFYTIQKTAKYELTALYLKSQLYEDAICNSNFLLNSGEEKEYIEMSIGFALMQLADYKANDDFNYIHQNSNEIQGSSQRINYLFEKFSDVELAVLALSYNWNLSRNYQNNQFIKEIVDKTFEILIVNLGLKANDFNKVYNPDSDYYKNAFISLFTEKEFSEKFSKNEQNKITIEKEKDELIHNAEKRKLIAEKNKLIQKKGFALGIDTIVIINPLCLNINYHKKDLIQWERAEKTRHNLVEVINSNSQNIELKTYLLDLKYFKKNDIDKYNDYCFLSSWFSEKCSHYSDNYLVYNKTFTDYLIEKYNTKYFAWIGLYQEFDMILTSHQNTTLEFFLFNIDTGEIVLSQKELISSFGDNNDINSSIKKILLQIKRVDINHKLK